MPRKPDPIVVAAKEAGEMFYFTGLPCVHGHIGLRRTNNHVCVTCEKNLPWDKYPRKQKSLKEFKKEHPKFNPKEITKLFSYAKWEENLIAEHVKESGRPRSRQEAIDVRIPFYYQSEPCKYGHQSIRSTRSGDCCECRAIKAREKARKLTSQGVKIKRPSPEKECEKSISYYHRNKEKVRAYRRTHSYIYRKYIKTVTPKWLSKFQKYQLSLIYTCRDEINKVSDVKYEVDHIVPIQGKEVCGLHVPWNLRVIPQKTNRTKSNKHNTSALKSNGGVN